MKSDSATVTVPELEFEIPMGTQKGTITTVEGMLREASEALSVLQPQRAQQDPETAAVISQFFWEPSSAHCSLSKLPAAASTARGGVVLLKTVMSFLGPIPDHRCEMHKGCVGAHCICFILSG